MASESSATKSESWPPAVIWAVRVAIAAVALLNLWSFVDYLPSLRVREPVTNFYTTQLFLIIYVINPLASMTALILAAQGRRLRLAAVLASIYPLYSVLSIVIFAIGVMIYGF